MDHGADGVGVCNFWSVYPALPKGPGSQKGRSLVGDAADLLCKTIALAAAECGRGLFLQWGATPHVPVCDLRSVPLGHLERSGDVARLYLRLPLVGCPIGWPSIGSDDSLLCLLG